VLQILRYMLRHYLTAYLGKLSINVGLMFIINVFGEIKFDDERAILWVDSCSLLRSPGLRMPSVL